MEIDGNKLHKARRILGAKNDTQAVDQALSLVIANKEIENAIGEFFGAIPDFEIK